MHELLFTRRFWHVSEDSGIAWLCDGPCACSVALSTCCAQVHTVVTVMMETSLGQHGIELCFRFPQGWPLSDHFQRLLVPQHVLSTFHNQLEPRLDQLQ